MEKNQDNFWKFNPKKYLYTTGGILVDVDKNTWAFIDIDECLKLKEEFLTPKIILKEHELVNYNVNYGRFSIEEGAEYVNYHQRETPEYIGIFESNSNNKIILNYMEEFDGEFEFPFKRANVSSRCLIVGIDFNEDGIFQNYAPLSFSTMRGIIKGCLALNENDLKKKQSFLKRYKWKD